MQDDVLLSQFTPKEAIKFSANLHLPISEKEKNLKVDQLIRALGLERCQNTKIGNVFEKGVSGGERKRTSIAVELITNPSVIFLDEPTTGLDSVTALRICQVLAEMADNGRTIMCTIH